MRMTRVGIVVGALVGVCATTLGADRVAITLEGVQDGWKGADTRLWYSVKDQTLNVAESGINLPGNEPALTWHKRVLTDEEHETFMEEWEATKYARLKPSRKMQGPFKLRVEVTEGGVARKWESPLDAGVIDEQPQAAIEAFLESQMELARKDPEGRISVEADCMSLDAQGTVDVVYTNHAKKPVRFLPTRGVSDLPLAKNSIPGWVELAPGGTLRSQVHFDGAALLRRAKKGPLSEPMFFTFSEVEGLPTEFFRKPTLSLTSAPGCFIETKIVDGKPVLKVQPTFDELNTLNSKKLTAAQRQFILTQLPDEKLLAVVSGQFGGKGTTDVVVVLWNPNSDPYGKTLRRFAFIAGSSGMRIVQIPESPGSRWVYRFDGKRFHSEFKVTHPLADPTLKKGSIRVPMGSAVHQRQSLCFPTSQTSDNWDCYLAQDGTATMVMWFQKAEAG